jgi:hypothetical protein
MAGLVSIAALARVLSRRSRKTQPVPPAAEDDPAEALRQKLTETRAAEPDAAPPPEPATTTPTETHAEPSETPDERRARIHAKAQEAIEAMQDPPT